MNWFIVIVLIACVGTLICAEFISFYTVAKIMGEKLNRKDSEYINDLKEEDIFLIRNQEKTKNV